MYTIHSAIHYSFLWDHQNHFKIIRTIIPSKTLTWHTANLPICPYVLFHYFPISSFTRCNLIKRCCKQSYHHPLNICMAHLGPVTSHNNFQYVCYPINLCVDFHASYRPIGPTMCVNCAFLYCLWVILSVSYFVFCSVYKCINFPIFLPLWQTSSPWVCACLVMWLWGVKFDLYILQSPMQCFVLHVVCVTFDGYWFV